MVSPLIGETRFSDLLQQNPTLNLPSMTLLTDIKPSLLGFSSFVRIKVLIKQKKISMGMKELWFKMKALTCLSMFTSTN